MRTPVVVPFTRWRPEVEAALDAYAPGWERRFVGLSEWAYYWLIRRLWSEGGFAIVEQDVVIDAAIVEFDDCPEPWCVRPIPRHLPPHIPLLWSLGCVRFSDELVRAEPGLPAKLGQLSVSGAPAQHWRTLDTAIGKLLRGDHRLEAHVHPPALVHLPRP